MVVFGSSHVHTISQRELQVGSQGEKSYMKPRREGFMLTCQVYEASVQAPVGNHLECPKMFDGIPNYNLDH